MGGKIVVGPGMKVTLNFAIKLAEGDLIDSTKGKAAEFVVVDGSLLPGFERAMFGMEAGEQAQLEIPAESGFGEPNPENIKVLKRVDFPEDVEPQEGLVVYFTDVNNNELPGVIQSYNAGSVTVNFNHPLAGRNLVFDVDIIDIERVSDEIIRVGE